MTDPEDDMLASRAEAFLIRIARPVAHDPEKDVSVIGLAAVILAARLTALSHVRPDTVMRLYMFYRNQADEALLDSSK